MDNKFLTPKNINKNEKEKIKKEILTMISIINRLNINYNKALKYRGFSKDKELKNRLEKELRNNKNLLEKYKKQLDYYNISYTEDEINNI